MVTAPLVAPHDERIVATAFAAKAVVTDAAADAKMSKTQRDNNGLFYLDGDVGRTSIRFLVDTGASHVVLSHDDARKIKSYSALRDSGTVITAGGPVTVDWIAIDEIDFGGHVIRNLKAAVPRRDVGVSLLGQNALAQFTSVHIDGDRLTFVR